MADWKTRRHLEDHYGQHGGKLRCRSVAAYDMSAQETIAIGVAFTYIDDITGLRRRGYFHRESSRFAAVDLDGHIVSHFQTDEAYAAELFGSTYQD